MFVFEAVVITRGSNSSALLHSCTFLFIVFNIRSKTEGLTLATQSNLEDYKPEGEYPFHGRNGLLPVEGIGGVAQSDLLQEQLLQSSIIVPI